MASAHIWTLGILFTLSEWCSLPVLHLYYPLAFFFRSFTDVLWVTLQVGWDLSRWLSQKLRSVSQKGIQWLLSAPIQFRGALIFSGMSSMAIKVSSSFWNTSEGTPWLKATTVLRLNLTRAKPLSTWRNHLFSGVTLPCTSVLWATQWWGTQRELNTNPEHRKPCSWSLTILPQGGGVALGFVLHYTIFFFFVKPQNLFIWQVC